MPRLLAIIIDGLIGIPLVIPGIILFLVGAAIDGGIGTLILFLGIIAYFGALLAWIVVIFVGMAKTGQTPGKRMMGIKVTTDSGQPIGLGGAVLRWLLQTVLNSFVYIGSLWMLWDEDKKTLYDKILNNRAFVVEKGSLLPLFPNGKPF